jgi:hypothetical protein
VYLDTRPIPASGALSTTEVITVGESYGQYVDEAGNAHDVGYLLDDDLLPETPYFAAVGVMDHRTGLTSRSRMISFSLPLGDIGLIGPQHSIVADRSVTFTVDVTMTEDVFFDVDLYIDTEGLPQGLDVTFLDNAQRAARLRNARDARVPVGITVNAGQEVPAGHYVLPVIAYSGGIKRQVDVELVVLGAYYVPIMRRP